jgi:hypothetical protein
MAVLGGVIGTPGTNISAVLKVSLLGVLVLPLLRL